MLSPSKESFFLLFSSENGIFSADAFEKSKRRLSDKK